MEVALLSSGCETSKLLCDKVEVFFQRMITLENQRITTVVKRFDVSELDQLHSAAEVFRAKIQVMAISSHSLSKMTNDDECCKINIQRLLDIRKAIFVTVGVLVADVQAYLRRLSSSCKEEWFILELPELKLNTKFRDAFTSQVLKIYKEELLANSLLTVFPKKVTNEQPKLSVFIKKPVGTGDKIDVGFTKLGDSESVNPVALSSALLLRIPESLCTTVTSLVDVSVCVNGDKLGSKIIKYEYQPERKEDHLEILLKDLPGFMDFLDNKVSSALSRNVTNKTDCSLDPELKVVNDSIIAKGSKLPTLMHFAAFYGLEKTAWMVLDEMDGFGECSVRNDMDETPLDVATETIRKVIEDYHEIRNHCTAAVKFKQIPLVRRSLIIPAQVDPKLKDSSNLEDVGSSDDQCGSLESSVEIASVEEVTTPTTTVSHIYVNDLSSDIGSPCRLGLFEKGDAYYENVSRAPQSLTEAEVIVERRHPDSSGDELDGLMTEYENDISTKQRLDTLVHRWSTRNEGISSPEEKQERLSGIRSELLKISEESRKTKKPSLLSRICTFLGRRKHVTRKETELDYVEAFAGDSSSSSRGKLGQIATTVFVDESERTPKRQGQQRDAVKWKMSPVMITRTLPCSPETPGRPPDYKTPSTPQSNTMRKFRPMDIRTPPETPRRPVYLRMDTKPPLPEKSKGRIAENHCYFSPMNSPVRHLPSDIHHCAPPRVHASPVNYYKVPPVPIPASFPPLEVKAMNTDDDFL